MPATLGVLGIVSLTGTMLPEGDLVDLTLLAAALVIAAVAGGLSGWVTKFRPVTASTRKRLTRAHRRGRRSNRPLLPAPTFEIRTGWIGAALWFVALLGRYGIEGLAEHMHFPLAQSTGMGLLIVAITDATRKLVLRHRSPSTPGSAMSDEQAS